MKEFKSKIHKYRLVSEKSDIPKVRIIDSRDISDYVKKYIYEGIDVYESMYILFLNRANNVTGYYFLSKGGTIGTVFDIKLLCKYALDSLAQSVILVHNHPSGNLSPSQQDIDLTKKAKAGLNLLDINLLDHVIITEFGYYSFTDSGLLCK